MPEEVLRKKLAMNMKDAWIAFVLSSCLLGSFGYNHVVVSWKIFKVKSNGKSRDFSVPGRHPIKLQPDRSTSPRNWLSKNTFFFQWQKKIEGGKLLSEVGATLGQKGGGCPTPGNIKCKAGQDFKQPDQAEDAHCRGIGLDYV